MSQENRTSLQKQIEEAETKIKQLEHQNTRLENRGRYLQKGERAKRTISAIWAARSSPSPRRRTGCPKRNSTA